MDVRCPQCQTLYELDENQVGARSVTLKCSQCRHVFRLEVRSGIVQENQRRWMIRRGEEDDVLYINTFDVLHEWIMRQKVHPEDEISRTGEKWVELGSIGEFMPMFQVVESISRIEGELSGRNDISSIATRRADTPPPAKPPGKRERVRTSIQFGGTPGPSSADGEDGEEVTKNARPSTITPHELPPAPGDRESSAPTPAEPFEEAGADPSWSTDLEIEGETSGSYPAQRSSAGPIVFVGVLGVAVVGAYFAFFSERGGNEPTENVVTIGATSGGTSSATTGDAAPREAIDRAIGAAVDAAAQQNAVSWTTWHEAASKPFYVALDTAYAAADEASAGVELETKLRDARRALENGRMSEASKMFQIVLTKDPDNPAATTGLGWALLENGEAERAASRFQAAMDADPTYGDAYIGLGTAYRQLGEAKKAYRAYDLYLGRFPRGEKASIARYQMEQLKKQLGM